MQLTLEQKDLLKEVRRFREEELLPREPHFLQEGTMPPQVRTALEFKARDRGLWALEVPRSLGGRELDETTMCLISEELYRDPSMFKFGGSPEPCLYLGTEQQKARYLLPVIRGERRSCYAFTEPGTGSDFAGIATRAERKGEGWVINGEKSLIAYMDRADFIILFATTFPGRGARGVTCFLIDIGTPGVIVHPADQSMGDAWETNRISFVDCVVSDDARLGEVDSAWPMANELLTHGRLRIAAYQLGIAQRCLDLAIDYAKERQTWGKPLASRQSIQWMIADSHVELQAARLMVYQAAGIRDAQSFDRTEDLAAKLYATEMAQRVTDRCLQIFGGKGYLRSCPVQSFYRQVRVWRIGHGSSEISRWMIARDLLGEAAR
jgi:acyl-CoA dehydrogenase